MLSQNVKKAALLAVATAGSVVSGLGQQPIVAFTNSTGTYQIAGGSISAGQILVSSNDYWGVIRAAGDLAMDFGRVTGTNYTLSNGVNASAPASYVYNPVNNMNNTFVSNVPCLYALDQAHGGYGGLLQISGSWGECMMVGMVVRTARTDVRTVHDNGNVKLRRT